MSLRDTFIDRINRIGAIRSYIIITPQGEKLTNMQLRNQWNSIDWKKVEKHVNKLQVRITKAVKKGKWYLVKRIQYLLTRSYYAKLLATRKPTQNTGKRTAGVDGETWSSSEAKMKAALNLTDKKYAAKPLKRSLYALALEPIAEATGDRTSFGFRKSRSTHDACEQVLIDALNPVITGWANYHQSVVSSEIFRKLDSRIWNMLWHWAKRRHPAKPKHWIADKYWHSDGNRKWVFSKGDKQLKLLSDTKIVRHARLKLDMNPYLDKDYFVLRKVKQGVKKLKGIAKNVWNKVENVTKPENKTSYST